AVAPRRVDPSRPAPAPVPAVHAAGPAARAVDVNAWYPRSLIYSGLLGLAVSVAGMILVGNRRRGW
ncbi:MAG TPA: hypothetical protein VES42_29185, partial [Pilimelia sp.]|nr:hypothetical protein [Pilimelia sp.]